MLGGNRSGKTEWGATEVISYCLGYRPYLDKSHPLYRTNRTAPVRVRIVGEDIINHVKNVLVPKLHKLVPMSEIRAIKKSSQGIELSWTFKNGSTLELMSYEMGSDKFEGWDGDLVWFDEPPPKDIYIACYRGLVDRQGKMLFTMTPLKEPWIKHELWDTRFDPKSNVDGFIFSTYDNIGYGLSKEAVEDFEYQLPKHVRETRLQGQFLHLQGLVYPEFSHKKHLVPKFEIPKDWPLYIAIDPHPRTPHAVLFMVVDPVGTKYVVDELFSPVTIGELAQQIKAKMAELGRSAKVILIDPQSSAPNPVNNITVQGEFARHGIYTIPAPRSLDAGIARVKGALTGIGGVPEVLVFVTCKNTIQEFGMYVWDEHRGTYKGEKEPKNKPKDKDDHMMENLYRLMLFNPYYEPRRTGIATRYQPNNSITGY